ncbi:unnamed protein product, partial [Medioppia subpectinata]
MCKEVILCMVILMTCCANQLVMGAENEVAKLFCNAEKVDTDKVTKIVECLNNMKNKRSADMKALGEKVEKTFQKECIGKAGDMNHKEWEKLEKCALDVLKK